MKIIKPIITENDNINNSNNINEIEESIPNINEIQKELMRSSINEMPTKLFDMNNCLTHLDKAKTKKIKKTKKKIMIRNTSLIPEKEIEKLKLAIKKDKKDKIELHDNLLLRSNKKVKKLIKMRQ